MKHALTLLTALLLAPLAALDAAEVWSHAAPKVNFRPGPEYGPDARKYQGVPSIERASNGRLWAVWYAGPEHEDRYNYVAGATSGDDGKTWSDLKFVIDPDGDGPLRACNPCLWRAPDGRLWLFWCQFPDSRIAESRIYAVTTENAGDENPVWSEPKFIHDGVTQNKPIVTRNGDWLLPTAIWYREGSCRVVASTDGGLTWRQRGAATVPLSEDRNCDEPMIVERDDGALWMLVRTRYGIGQTTSTDGGATWTTVSRADLPHTPTRFFIRRLRSGKLLLVKHGPLTGKPVGRRQLTAYLSGDDGKSWQGGLLLDERTVSYPDRAQAKDGTIYIIHDHNRYDDKHILMSAFTETDVLSGRPVSDKVRLRILINQATGVNPKPWLTDGRFLNLQTNEDGADIEGADLLAGAKADLAPVAGEIRVLERGKPLFNGLPYTVNVVPEKFVGKRFVFSGIARTGAVCRKDGVVYVFTPSKERSLWSVADMLVKQGFAKAAVREFVFFLSEDGKALAENVCSIYQKRMKAGERLELGRWGVIVF